MHNGQNGVSDVIYTLKNTQTIKAYAVQTLSNQFTVRKKQLTILLIFITTSTAKRSPGDLFTG